MSKHITKERALAALASSMNPDGAYRVLRRYIEQSEELCKEIEDLKHDNERLLEALSNYVNSEDSQG